ncbi:HopJ type III effector protein [Photobacterium profundum]|uniref:Type III effector n=1 Tax=Photobacterium profundum (strain SS9) TaxID=298386 RepID=Q6LK75_PHOPR|nr:HopJ type III effector protein [Photobacterium profundum]CAG22305.1 conserved hypothetical protein [Photobacterium profundum SS9]
MEALIHRLKTSPESIAFEKVIETINKHYDFSPAAFTNGLGNETLTNAIGTNEGSCRIFSFAKTHELSEAETLACFGNYYRIDVLQNPDNVDHMNIRNFMKYGWMSINFSTDPLMTKSA